MASGPSSTVTDRTCSPTCTPSPSTPPARVSRPKSSAPSSFPALVTVRKDPVDLAPVLARWDADEPDVDLGHLVHGLLDALVDGQFDAAMKISDATQDFEDHILDRAYREQNKSRGFDLCKCLIQMRRFASPMREVVGRFLRETPLVSPDLVPYFEDVQDHVVTITEASDIGLDVVSSLLDSEANEQGNELNDVAKS